MPRKKRNYIRFFMNFDADSYQTIKNAAKKEGEDISDIHRRLIKLALKRGLLEEVLNQE